MDPGFRTMCETGMTMGCVLQRFAFAGMSGTWQALNIFVIAGQATRRPGNPDGISPWITGSALS